MDKQYSFFAPGRVNLIGEHIDYNGGLVLPIAIKQGIKAKVAFNSDGIISIQSAQIEGVFKWNLSNENHPKSGDWTDYAKGIIKTLKEANYSLQGCTIDLESSLPVGSGLSSSAALELLLAYILINNRDAADKAILAQLAQKAENEFVGVNCGIMDQFAVAMGKKEQAILLDCNTLNYQYVPFNLGDYQLVIINSKMPRTLAGSAYNERRHECEQALKIISEHKTIKALVDADITDLQFIKDSMIRQRVKHVISEQQRVLKAVDTLKNGQLPTFGQLMFESHISLKNDYAVSSDGLDFIVDFGANFDGCLGSRLTGAGFGGCCIALVHNKKIEAYKNQLGNLYQKRFSLDLEFLISQAEDGVKFNKRRRS